MFHLERHSFLSLFPLLSLAHLPVEAMTFVDIYSEGVRKKVYYYTLLALITILCYGIYLPFLLKSLILIRPRIRSSVRSRWLLALIFALFISTTVHLIACLLRTATVIDFRFSFVQVLPVPTKMGIVPQLDFPAATAFYYTGSINWYGEHMHFYHTIRSFVPSSWLS
ncbi:hypothetical protein DL96DRAFT_738841 [Flagelloscypha sp. PMI_526]|nr:hypothetical protein DL96DRAFT_738841 [Flagelloscypha sp. PMI_526]